MCSYTVISDPCSMKEIRDEFHMQQRPPSRVLSQCFTHRKKWTSSAGRVKAKFICRRQSGQNYNFAPSGCPSLYGTTPRTWKGSNTMTGRGISERDRSSSKSWRLKYYLTAIMHFNLCLFLLSKHEWIIIVSEKVIFFSLSIFSR
jgi:hypothetical protein